LHPSKILSIPLSKYTA